MIWGEQRNGNDSLKQSQREGVDKVLERVRSSGSIRGGTSERLDCSRSDGHSRLVENRLSSNIGLRV